MEEPSCEKQDLEFCQVRYFVIRKDASCLQPIFRKPAVNGTNVKRLALQGHAFPEGGRMPHGLNVTCHRSAVRLEAPEAAERILAQRIFGECTDFAGAPALPLCEAAARECWRGAPPPGGSVRGERANFTRLVLGCIDADFCK